MLLFLTKKPSFKSEPPDDNSSSEDVLTVEGIEYKRLESGEQPVTSTKTADFRGVRPKRRAYPQPR